MSIFKEIKDTVVQEDNPNSPHKVIARANEGLVGKQDKPEPPKKKKGRKSKKSTATKKTTKKSTKKTANKSTASGEMFSPGTFGRMIWGDEK